MKRRDFLRNSAAVTAAGFAAPYFVPSHVLAAPGRRGANDRLKVAFIGCGGRARHLMTGENLKDHADIVAVADCELERMDGAAKLVPGSENWARYQDYRKLLEKEKIDAVFVATTTHARALICIHAMQAGCDVYAEKPVALTIAEGRTLVKAARKYNKVFQVGTQQRSIPSNVYASRLVREGAIGKIREVITLNFIAPETWQPQPAEPMPKGLDWDMWCNQTELRPYRTELHRGWARWRDYDGGGISYGVTGWGTHALDQVQCALGTSETGPVEVWPEGSGPTAKVTMKYANGTLLRCHGPKRDLADLGAIFVGELGVIEIKRGSFTSTIPELLKAQPTTLPANVPGECVWHFDNFFECIRTRNKPNADIEIAHRSTTVCYLINIARDLGRKLKWDPQTEKFIGDDEANQNMYVSRPRRKGYELPSDLA
ncbi:MAG TPA: Gfo/Idh/MocA family oxidoreductase [Phycisphaerae bacterium]|nr:Gfo/Idh/MocA family oxidoreductase [Phycisphaerae bacterium]HOJ73909.1 Gfo/Idh/MocA family oxidoreductase [Phycisphaerae bacterium]HOM50850.1 Gfo/Idh/MocA family oxidoreductase [Phycisphaerae bacterium]HOQ88477.1 Gfo/Idh/MocA family oxidoreductase [Phycisphaerae bacterium]HPP25975.1 Gfo/Idh/MocA family oxidoreductase [Phycisphaerae bacterium]